MSSAGNTTVHTCNPTSTSASAVQVFQQSATTPNLLTFPYQQCISGENSMSLSLHFKQYISSQLLLLNQKTGVKFNTTFRPQFHAIEFYN